MLFIVEGLSQPKGFVKDKCALTFSIKIFVIYLEIRVIRRRIATPLTCIKWF